MYICQICRFVQSPRTPAAPVVVEVRNVEYRNLVHDAEKDAMVEKVSKGTEIVKELRVCPECAEAYNAACRH